MFFSFFLSLFLSRFSLPWYHYSRERQEYRVGPLNQLGQENHFDHRWVIDHHHPKHRSKEIKMREIIDETHAISFATILTAITFFAGKTRITRTS